MSAEWLYEWATYAEINLSDKPDYQSADFVLRRGENSKWRRHDFPPGYMLPSKKKKKSRWLMINDYALFMKRLCGISSPDGSVGSARAVPPPSPLLKSKTFFYQSWRDTLFIQNTSSAVHKLQRTYRSEHVG